MDDVQRKLALIDRQLAGGPTVADIHARIISTSPLLFLAVGLVAGILIQSKCDLSWFFWVTLLILCTAGTFIFFPAHRRGPNNQLSIVNNQFIMAYLAFACFTCLGAIRLTAFQQPRPNDVRNLVSDQRKLATIRWTIITEPYRERQNWQFARFTPTDAGSSFYLKMSEIKTVDGWAKATGTIRVRVDEPVLDLKAGDFVQAYCWLERFQPPTNPGQFNVAKYLARKNVFIAADVASRDGIEVLEQGSAGAWRGIKTKLREKATYALLGSPSPESPSEGLLQALLLGYRADIDNATYEAFYKTGLLHFISLSGMHLGILMGIVWWLGKTAGLMKRARSVICIIAICVFLLIVPPRPPTLRAAIIGFVFCLSFLFRRRFNSLNTLSLAAIVLLLIEPTQLFEAGWQLSFASVLGLVLLCHRIHFFLYEKITGVPWTQKARRIRPFFRIASRPGPYLLRLFSTGLTAWLSGAGILLYHFYMINPLTFIWTVIAFPFVALILTVGYLKMVLAFLFPTVASGVGLIVSGLSRSLIWVVELIADLDISRILVGHVSPALVILYYALVFCAAFAVFRRPLLKKTICTGMALGVLVWLGVVKWQRTYRDDLVITCLDVGHGQAILAQLPGRANILFDAGSLHRSDVGSRIVAPFLDYMGIDEIDAVVISHNDVDHINGIPEIVEHCRVGRVYVNNAFLSEADEWGTAKFLGDWLTGRGLAPQGLAEDLQVDSKATIRMIWPTEQAVADGIIGDNDKSLVSLIKFAGRKILLCSDIENLAQKELLRLNPNLKADVVVVPHHGSVKTLDTTFLESLDAEVLICSCGQREYERMNDLPASQGPNKATWFYTPGDGAIALWITKDGAIHAATGESQLE
jgi:competence protein ComEC